MTAVSKRYSSQISNCFFFSQLSVDSFPVSFCQHCTLSFTSSKMYEGLAREGYGISCHRVLILLIKQNARFLYFQFQLGSIILDYGSWFSESIFEKY